jgi:adenylate cyclase
VWVTAIATLLCTLIAAAHSLGVTRLGWLDALEQKTVDARFRQRGPRPVRSDDIVLVALDEEADARTIGQSRRGWARLLQALAGYRVRVVGVDAIFDLPEARLPVRALDRARQALAQLQSQPEITRSQSETLALTALGAVVEENRGDEVLARALPALPVYLGARFFQDRRAAPTTAHGPALLSPARYGEVVDGEAAAWKRPPRVQAAVGALPALVAAARGSGFIDMAADDDGRVRAPHLAMQHEGQVYLPLALALLRELRPGPARLDPDARQVELGRRQLPIGRGGRAHLWFLGPAGTVPQVRAADVLAGRVPRSRLENRLVVVGSARDLLDTPFGRLPRVELHATLAHNALHGELLAPAGPGLLLWTLLLLGAVLSGLQHPRLRARWGRRRWLLPALLLAAHALCAHLLFARAGVLVEMAAPAVGAALVALSALAATWASEGRRVAALRSAFAGRIAPVTDAELALRPVDVRLGGTRREVTLLCAQVDGFPLLAELLAPTELMRWLRERGTTLAQCVLAEQGFVERWQGGTLHAVFGAPLDLHDHAGHGLRAALALRAALPRINAALQAEGHAGIELDIAVHTGPAALGEVGPAQFFEYGATGQAVQLSQQLPALARRYRAPIVLGARAVQCAGARFAVRELDLVRLAGEEQPVRLFELIGPRGTGPIDEDDLERFARALAALRARRWDEAEAGWNEFLRWHPDDGPAQVMRRRAQALRQAPPPADWDGSWPL